MNANEIVEDRLRRTYPRIGASTTITSRSVPDLRFDEPSRHAPRHRSHVLFAAVASIVVPAVASGAVVLATRGTDRRLNVVGSNSEPSTSTPTLTCPLSGVAPNGKTYGTLPHPPSTAPTPDYVGVEGNDGQRVGYERLGGASPNTVYGCDLTTVVGHLVPNKGFVPVGVNPETVPTIGPQLVTIDALQLFVDAGDARIEMVWAEPGSALADSLSRAGLGRGDTITSINGTPITSGAALETATADIQARDHIDVAWTDSRGQEHTARIDR